MAIYLNVCFRDVPFVFVSVLDTFQEKQHKEELKTADQELTLNCSMPANRLAHPQSFYFYKYQQYSANVIVRTWSVF